MYCKSCQDAGKGDFYACMKVTRGYTSKHVDGVPVSHYSFAKKTKKQGSGASGSSGMSESSASGGGSASEDGRGEDDADRQTQESPNSVARRMARRASTSAPAPRSKPTRGSSSSS